MTPSAASGVTRADGEDAGMDLTTFLLARIAEDEATARDATQVVWVPEDQGWASPDGTSFIRAPYHELTISADDTLHITRWQPARVLAECAAKRAIVEGHAETWDLGRGDYLEGVWRSEDHTIRLLAAVYAEHPDYDEGWRL